MLIAELSGIIHGLELVWRLNERKIVIETDSKVAIELCLIRCVVKIIPYYMMVKRINEWRRRSWEVRFVH